MNDHKKPLSVTSPMDHGEVKILNEEVIYNGFIRLSKLTVEIPTRHGGRLEQIREIHDHGSAAVILPVDYGRQKVLLVKQWRIPPFINHHIGPMIEAVAGLIDPDETPEMCAIREAREETGYEVKNLKKITECYSSPGTLTEYFHLFIGEYGPHARPSKGGGIVHEGEDIEVLEVGFEDLRSMLSSGTLKDAKTILAVHWLLNDLNEQLTS